MSARDEIAWTMKSLGAFDPTREADAVLVALHAAGYRIIHDSENHGPTVGRAAKVAETHRHPRGSEHEDMRWQAGRSLPQPPSTQWRRRMGKPTDSDKTELCDRPVQRIATLDGVREYSEGWDVELWRSREGRLIVRAYNEGHNNYTNVDLIDLLRWLSGPRSGILHDCERG